MRRRTFALVFIALGVVCAVASPAVRSDSAAGVPAPTPTDAHGGKARGPIKLAITVDDLPGGGPEVSGYTHVHMVKDIIAALQAHRVPHPAGFIVGSMLETQRDRSVALDAWVHAGFLVGNHTYSHDRMSALGVTRFMDDITKNRTVVDPLEKRAGQTHRYFRFPYLEEGATHQERRMLWHLLQREHYALVRVSVTFSDTDWADAYLRCQESGDTLSLQALDRSYLSQALANLHWSVEAADDVLGRAIPHILLLHVNVPTAKNLDTLLRVYEAQGVQFIPLEEALRDPAYSVYYDAPGGDLLSQASASLGRAHAPRIAPLDELIDRLCR